MQSASLPGLAILSGKSMAYISVMLGFGLLAGLLGGLFGIGGGVVLNPILMAFGIPSAQVIGIGALATWAISTSALLRSRRHQHIPWRDVAWLGLPSLALAPVGVQIALFLPQSWLMRCFALLLWLASALILKGTKVNINKRPIDSDDFGPISPINKLLGLGALTGLLAGTFGIGGGVILVPLLLGVSRVPYKSAVITGLGVVWLASASATLTHVVSDTLSWSIAIPTALGGVAGAQLGTLLRFRARTRFLKLLFALLLLVLGVILIVKSFP